MERPRFETFVLNFTPPVDSTNTTDGLGGRPEIVSPEHVGKAMDAGLAKWFTDTTG